MVKCYGPLGHPTSAIATTEGHRGHVVELDGLHLYAIALNCMSTEVMHTVFGHELFPSGAVDDAAALVPHVLRAFI